MFLHYGQVFPRGCVACFFFTRVVTALLISFCSIDEEEEAEGNNAPAVDASGQYAFTSDRMYISPVPEATANMRLL